MLRRLLTSGFALAAVLLVPFARADESPVGPDVKAISRERLLEDAKRVIQRSGLESLASAREVVEGLRQTVRKTRDQDGTSDAELDARLAWLLGPEESDEGDVIWGALLQAVWLGAWLDGTTVGAPYALRAPAADEPVADPIYFTAETWQALDEDDRRRLLSDSTLDLARLGDRSLEPSRQLDFQVTLTFGSGEEAREATLDPVAGLRQPPALENGWVLVLPEELQDEISEAWLGVRTEQADVHLDAWSEERPSDLVTEGGVSRLVEREKALEAELRRWQELRARVRDALDAMVERDLDVNRRVFALENELLAAKEAPGADDPASEAGRRRARLYLEELRAKLEHRMLYLAAARAGARLAFCDRTEDLLEQERVVIGTVQDRYEQRLRRVRREAQLSHLQQDRGWFELNRTQAQGRAEEESEPARSTWTAYVALLDDLVAMNDSLVELVNLVQSLEAHVDLPPEAPRVPEEREGAEPSAPEVEQATPAPAGEVPPQPTLGPLLEPERYVHRPRFASQARDAFADPAFDAYLVARTYAAADDHVVSRRRAIEASQRAEALEAEYAKRSRDLSTRLDDLSRRLPSYMAWDMRQTRERQEPYDELLRRALKDVRREREAARLQIADLEALCRDLTGLGARSLGIRATRKLDAASLDEAAETARSGLDRAWRWLTLRDEPNVGSYLAARWAYVVACLLVAAVLVIVVRTGRRRIDDELHRLGRGVPVLREEGVTVGGEAAEAREVRKHEQEAAAEAEAAALADASQKAVVQQPAAEDAAVASDEGEGGDEGESGDEGGQR